MVKLTPTLLVSLLPPYERVVEHACQTFWLHFYAWAGSLTDSKPRFQKPDASVHQRADLPRPAATQLNVIDSHADQLQSRLY
jgi:hypothetical protein